jgi:hypothetical protein
MPVIRCQAGPESASRASRRGVISGTATDTRLNAAPSVVVLDVVGSNPIAHHRTPSLTPMKLQVSGLLPGHDGLLPVAR